MRNLAFVGDVGIDIYDDGVERVGGCSYHAAKAAAEAGAGVTLISAVGTDAAGQDLKKDFPDLEQRDGVTARQRIRLRSDGERELYGYNAGVLPDWRLNQRQQKIFATAALVHTVAFAQIGALFEHVLSLPRQGRLFVDFMDLSDFGRHAKNIEPFWSRIDGVFLGLSAGESLGCVPVPGKTVVVTQGAAGSWCFEKGRIYRCSAVPVATVRNTTGAGDTYAGTFLAHYANQASVVDAMQAASAAAAHLIATAR